MRVAGIDPGAKGAICVLDTEDPDYIALLELDKQTPYSIAKWLHNQKPEKILIEKVHSLYGMSAKSNFNFGYNFGEINAIAAIISKGSNIHLVTPKQWQKAVGVTVQGFAIKKMVAELAEKHHPNGNYYGPRGGLRDGLSDATMIAHYACYQHKENSTNEHND